MIRIFAFCTNEFLESGDYEWGAERRFRSIIAGLRQEDFEYVTLSYGNGDGFGGVGTVKYAVDKQKRWRFIRLVASGIRLTRQLHCKALYAYHNDPSFVIVPTFLVSFACRLPFFTVIHDDAMKYEDAIPLRNLVQYFLQDPKLTIQRKLARLSLGIIRRTAMRHATACFAVSDSTADYARSVGIPKVRVVGNGVNQNWFMLEDSPKRYDGVFMGRLERAKGVDTLLMAWANVVSEIPEAKLLLIGSTPEKEKDFMDKTISELDLKRNVRLTGYVPDSEAQKGIASSKIFIFPSRREGFGISVAEAMAAGVPCIISDVQALKRNFAKAAIVVSKEDFEALGNAIVNLLRDEPRRAEMSRLGRELAAMMHWSQVCAREGLIMRENLRE